MRDISWFYTADALGLGYEAREELFRRMAFNVYYNEIDGLAKAEAVRTRLWTVYSQMKNRTGDIRFLSMTGVSRFTKMSVFSGLNNIVDISMDENYATMFGYTEEEPEAKFEAHLRAHASAECR